MRLPLVVALVLTGCEAAPVTFAPLDLGVGPVAQRREGTLRLVNGSARPAVLRRLELVRGSVGFTVVPTSGAIASGAEARWLVRFESELVGPSEATWRARFDTGTVEFTVRARGALPCVVPTFELGSARVDEAIERRFTLTNPLDQPGEAFVGELGAPFSVSPHGRIRLSPRETREVVVRFSPGRVGVHEAAWRVRPSADCLETSSSVRGRGVPETLTFAPGRLDFGALASGETKALTVELINQTTAALNVTALTTSSPTFRVVTVAPLEVPAGGRVPVRVLGSAGQPTNGELVVTTSDEALRLPLVSNLEGACVSASRSRVDLPRVEVGCRSQDERVTLTNRCPHRVRLAPSTSAGFGLVSARRVLDPGASAELVVTALPTSEGAQAGALTVEIDVLDGAERLEVPLAVNAAPAEHLVETTTVAPSRWGRADVLLVLDDSPTMVPLASAVERNLGDFGRYLTANGLDTRVAVMTTSTAPAALGQLRETSDGGLWLTNPAATELAAHAAITGTAQGRSSCLEALRAGLSAQPPLAALPRPDTALQIVCVTNGPDQIEAAPMSAIAEILPALPETASFAVVARFGVPACPGELERGVLSTLAWLTNGTTEEICTPNWSIALERVSFSFGFGTLFYLQRMPDPSRAPLRVWIDDVELPEFDQPPFGRIWWWDGALNAVSLEPLYAPEPGRTLRVQYSPQCAR